jgi:hypothetical protein
MNDTEFGKSVDLQINVKERSFSFHLPSRRDPYPELSSLSQASLLFGADFHLPCAEMKKRLSIRAAGIAPPLKEYLATNLPVTAIDHFVGFISLVKQKRPSLVIDLGDRDVHEAEAQDRAHTASLYQRLYATTPPETRTIILNGNHDLSTPEGFESSLQIFGMQFGYQRIGQHWLLIFTDTNLLSPRLMRKLISQAPDQNKLETQISALQADQQKILAEAGEILNSKEERDKGRKAIVCGHHIAGLRKEIAKLPNVHTVITGHRHLELARTSLMLKDANGHRPHLISVGGFSLGYPLIVYKIRPRHFDLITLDGLGFQRQSLVVPSEHLNDVW